jgi:hypothetical protein
VGRITQKVEGADLIALTCCGWHPYPLCDLLIVRDVLGNSCCPLGLSPWGCSSIRYVQQQISGMMLQRTSSTLGSASNLRHGPARPSVTLAASGFDAAAGGPLASAFCPLCCSSPQRRSSLLLPARLLTGGCCGACREIGECVLRAVPQAKNVPRTM